MLRARLVVLAWLASCGVRAPAPIDVEALLRARGAVDARRDLVIRSAADPRDVAVRLALAALDDRLGRPSDAIDGLEAVVAIGGPIGVRWHAVDQARLARLIAARGRARLARGAATALTDLERARGLGAAIGDDELHRARIAGAIVAMRHSEAAVRDRGRRVLAQAAAPSSPASAAGSSGSDGDAAASGSGEEERRALAGDASGDATAAAARAAWRGARPGATAEERGGFGAWLWRQGARRAAWDELSAWRAAAAPPRHDAIAGAPPGRADRPASRELEDAYLAAARWWTPLDAAGPAIERLVEAASGGPGGGEPRSLRCAFAACAPREVAGDDAAERAYLMGPLAPPVRDPADAAAVVVIALHQALRGEASWGPAIAARVDLAALGDPARLAEVPGFARPVIAWLAGREVGAVAAAPAADATADHRLVIAAARVLAGGGAADIAGLLDDSPAAAALRAMAAPRAAFAGDARAEAVARHAAQVVDGAANRDALRAIAAGFARDPAIADRLGREAIAAAVDAAALHATLGAVFDALGDPARARAAWQAAVDASAEPRFVRGLAEAQARQGDGDAALVTATAAAAASGDPSVVWLAVARALAGARRHVHALDAARSAIDLAGPETLAAALDVAIAASRALDRDAQAAGLAVQRARIAPAGGTLGDRDPTDARAALDAHRERASSGTAARLWVASRWNPRDVELRAALLATTPAGDPRRDAIIGELVDLAGDRDPEVSRTAAAALR